MRIIFVLVSALALCGYSHVESAAAARILSHADQAQRAAVAACDAREIVSHYQCATEYVGDAR